MLQYDRINKTFIIIAPKIAKKTVKLRQEKKCGIDIGVRTFVTTYGKDACYEIGTDVNKTIDRLNNRLDQLKSKYKKNEIGKKKFKTLSMKYSERLQNKINDMHCKTANFLLNKYHEINIGNIKIKQLLSNKNKNDLANVTKRRLVALSHYKFRAKLKQMAPKFGSIINEISEFQTSMKCCRCKNLKKDLGKNKCYKCLNCNLEIDRDINAAINIYNL